jgi:hypothetical protein
MSRLNFARLLMQAGRAGMRFGLRAVKACDFGICRGVGLGLGLPLVLERSGCPLSRPLLAFESHSMQTPVFHPRNIAPTGR